MNFTPSNDYAELRTQACALATMAGSLKKQLSHEKEDNAELRLRLALTGENAVRAERATNEQLTAALEAAEAREVELRARVVHYQALISAIVDVGVAGPDVPDAIDNDGQPYQRRPKGGRKMSDRELLPCPFCGGKPRYDTSAKLEAPYLPLVKQCFVRCGKCNAQTHKCHTKKTAVKRWNTRSAAAPKEEGK